jgi:sulfur-carrier protein
MQITVKLFATLRTGRFAEEKREYEPGVTVRAVMDDIGVTAEEATMVIVNGRHADYDVLLHEADVIALFPPIGGG